MTAAARREVGLNMMIGAGVIGGVALAHPVGNVIGRTISGAPIPWETYGWIYLLLALPATIAWLIGRAVWAKAWRDMRRERAATVVVPVETFEAMQDPAPADAPGLRAMVARRDARNRASSDEQGQGKPETPGGKDHG